MSERACRVERTGHEVIEHRLLMAMSDKGKVALVLDAEGLETLITSLECVPVKCGRRIEMLEDLKQLRRAASDA